MMELLYAAALIGLGLYNWYLTDKLVNSQETVDQYNDLIVTMAQELESLGSPNVKILRNEEVS